MDDQYETPFYIRLSIYIMLLTFVWSGISGPIYAQKLPIAPFRCFLPILYTVVPSDIRISEFMASNHSGILDADGDSSDWIELYNAGEWTVNLQGWYLTDQVDNPTKWEFPQRILESGDRLLVFASGKNRASVDYPLHTNFKLSKSGEYLGLIKPDGQTVSWAYTPAYPLQWPDIAYGIDSQGHERFLHVPTPNLSTDTASGNVRPFLIDLHHSPLQPQENQDLWITVQVIGSPVVQVQLQYRIMFDTIQTTEMYDDGQHQDGAAQDGIYGGLIDSKDFLAHQMIRYAVTATDEMGREISMPFSPDNNSLEYAQGTVVAGPTVTEELPAMHWYVADPDWYKTVDFPTDEYCSPPECICEPFCEDPYLRTNTTTSLFYAGKFYNNIKVRIRGNSSVSMKADKQSFKFRFAEREPFEYDSTQPRVDEINVNALWLDKSYIRNHISMELYQDVGVPASNTKNILLYQNGAFHSLANLVEQVDDKFLARYDLDPEGALYKMYNNLSNAEPRPDLLPGQNPGSVRYADKKIRLDEDHSDLQTLIDELRATDEEERLHFIFDTIDIPAAINYMAISALIGDWDMFKKNYYAYRNNAYTGEWQLFPWDRDQSWGASWLKDRVSPKAKLFHTYHDFPLTDAFFSSPLLSDMYLRRLRTLMDEWLQSPETPDTEFRLEQKFDEYLAQLEDAATTDRAKWGVPYGGLISIENAIQAIKTDYIESIRVEFYEDERLPAPQAELLALWDGEAPIRFETIEAQPASGKLDEAYLELQNQTDFAIDLSGWYITGDITYTLRPGVVLSPGQSLYISPDVMAFRSRIASPMADEKRFVQGNYQGVLSDTQINLGLYDRVGRLIDEVSE